MFNSPTSQLIDSISDFQILSLIRIGRITDIYHVNKSGTNYCLKIMHPDMMSDKNALLEFKNEYRALMTINEREFLQVDSWGEHEGSYYMLLEYFPQITLADQIYQSKLKAEDCIKLLKRIANTIRDSHNQGLHYLGIKPSNILYNNDEYRLIQLGQVRFQNTQMEYPPIMISEGVTEPELLNGEVDLSPTTDVYALSSVLRYCLCHGDTVPISELDVNNKLLLERLLGDRQTRPATCDEFIQILENYETNISAKREILPPKKNNQKVQSVSRKTIVFSFLCVEVILITWFILSNDSTAKKFTTFHPEKHKLLKPIGKPNDLTPAQQKFWNFIENYKLQALSESDSKVIRAEGIIPHQFVYLRQSSEPVIGNIKGAKDHADIFKKRYPWVEQLLAKYNVTLDVSDLFYGTTLK